MQTADVIVVVAIAFPFLVGGGAPAHAAGAAQDAEPEAPQQAAVHVRDTTRHCVGEAAPPDSQAGEEEEWDQRLR